jgi:hypothetical protein
MRQLGTFWGTLLAVRGYSNGESLVARNVGIAPAWERGRWRVRLIFMDHDDLSLPRPGDAHFRPDRILTGTLKDEAFGPGRPGLPRHPFSLVDFLGLAYRVGPAAASRGDCALRRSLARSYRHAGRAIRAVPSLRRLFSPRFLEESEAWDRTAAIFLAARGDVEGGGSWRGECREMLRRGGIDAGTIGIFVESAEEFAPFLRRMEMLFGGPPR